MSKKIELVPCPFCGGSAAMIAGFHEYWALCSICKASGKSCSDGESAIRAWNTRIPVRKEKKKIVRGRVDTGIEHQVYLGCNTPDRLAAELRISKGAAMNRLQLAFDAGKIIRIGKGKYANRMGFVP